MFVIKYVTVLCDKYSANFTRILDNAGCLYFTGYRMVLSRSGTSLAQDDGDGENTRVMIIILVTSMLVMKNACCKDNWNIGHE